MKSHRTQADSRSPTAHKPLMGTQRCSFPAQSQVCTEKQNSKHTSAAQYTPVSLQTPAKLTQNNLFAQN